MAISIKPSSNIKCWDYYDDRRGVRTTITFKNLGPRGIYISFDGDFAGMCHGWSAPGDDIVEFLKRVDMDYVLGKMVKPYVDLLDISAMNEEFYKYLNNVCHELDMGAVLLMAELEFATNGRDDELASDHLLYCFDFSGPLEKYEPVLDKCREYKEHFIFKWKYQYFWDNVWPAFVAEVEKCVNAK